VVVPTRDRPGSLRRCLAALAGQTRPVEVVVVDDGCADPRPVRAAACAAGARLLTLAGDGPAAARNAGAAAAGGEVVLFTDDDCEPAPGWAAALTAAVFAAPGEVAAGITVVPAEARAPVRASQTVIDALQLDRVPLERGAPLRFAPSCNLGCSRAVLGELPFDEAFPLPAGEDREWSARAGSLGRAPLLAPEAVVVHRQNEGLGAFARRAWRYGRGAAQLRARLSDPAATRVAPGFRRRLLARAARRGAAVLLLVALSQPLTAAGLLAERRRISRNRRAPAEAERP
jgi:glycosyltransferase involved in cell wall biosynthesis